MIDPLPIDEIDWNPALNPSIGSSTDLISPERDFGQSRAANALAFGMGMTAPGYNLFVMGPEGAGRRTLTMAKLKEKAAPQNPPDDWCYVDNFAAQRFPVALRLSPGQGQRLAARMTRFVNDLQEALRTAFQSEDYRNMKQLVEDEFKAENEKALETVEAAARADNLALLKTPMGFSFAPIQDGKVLQQEDYQALSDAEREAIAASVKKYEAELQKALGDVPTRAFAARQKMEDLNQQTATNVVDFLLRSIAPDFEQNNAVIEFLKSVRTDILTNVEIIISTLNEESAASVDQLLYGHPFYRRYLVNLIVDQAKCEGAPIVYEDEPNLERLIGTIEHRAEMGALQTDFHLIRAGALHRANGGYLVVEARKLLTLPFAWEALKRAMLSNQIRIETPAQAAGMAQTISLQPESIPLQTKIILVGDRTIYYTLSNMDPDFEKLFKVAVDFEDHIKIDDDNLAGYSGLLASLIAEAGTLSFDRAAIIRLLWLAARQAGNRNRYTTQLRRLFDLIQESIFFANDDNASQVEDQHVIKAICAKVDRANRIPQAIQDQIHDRVVAIDTDGNQVGQVNGLSVSQIGMLSFGKPARITARVALGKGDVIDIEREVELGGPIHSKGILILSGLLRAKFGIEFPLSLNASIVFEQSYGGVDGDSASTAEMCALLSAISQFPLKQGIAITGALNQMGEVQAIGGVNEKIEGFFDICNERGLTGTQGVIIPQSNKDHLVLETRVIDAVRDGQFHIYAVDHLDEAIELLTGIAPGTANDAGQFEADTVYGAVAARLEMFYRAQRKPGTLEDRLDG